MHGVACVLAGSEAMSASATPSYGVIVPVKPADRAKSRLAALGDPARRSLVAAFAADTVTAVLGSPLVAAVMVVTDDHRLARELAPLGARVMPDGACDDLNGSLVQAAAELARLHPGLVPAALCADLPALRTAELTDALEAAAGYPAAMVADKTRAGTTLLVASGPESFVPRFGPHSRAEHLADGAHEVDGIDVPTLRLDVDTPDDLGAALALGVGQRTTAACAGLRL